MYTFPLLIKEIRKYSELSQKEFAKTLGVSPVLIAMIETGQKGISKNFIKKLADKLNVTPGAITPFIFSEELSGKDLNFFEKKLLKIGEELQIYLLEKKAPTLKKHPNAE